jgi:hypothetical protein
MTQVFHLQLRKRTFGFLHKQAMVLKDFQNLRDTLEMRFPRFTINHDIIKEHEDKGTKIRSQYFVNEALESLEIIVESKRHNQKLIMASMWEKKNIRNANLFHADLLVT